MMKKLPGYVQTLTNRLRAGERVSDCCERKICVPSGHPEKIEIYFYEFPVGGGHIGVEEHVRKERDIDRIGCIYGK